MNTRRKLQFKEGDDEDIQLEPKRVQKASTRRGNALLRASEVSNNLVKDRGSKLVIIGADVEALYPSLVAEIIYRAVMETKVEFKGEVKCQILMVCFG